MVESPDGSIPEESPFYFWHKAILGRIEKRNTGRPGPHLGGWIKDAGFVNVTVRKFLIPHNIWPKDERLKRVGAVSPQSTPDIQTDRIP